MMVGEPPSASVAVAEQVSVEVTLTPLVGLIDTLATIGSVLSTETVMLLVLEPPSVSVAVTVQRITSLGAEVVLVSDKAVPEPRVVPALTFTHA